jgi:hypothetical protein
MEQRLQLKLHRRLNYQEILTRFLHERNLSVLLNNYNSLRLFCVYDR